MSEYFPKIIQSFLLFRLFKIKTGFKYNPNFFIINQKFIPILPQTRLIDTVFLNRSMTGTKNLENKFQQSEETKPMQVILWCQKVVLISATLWKSEIASFFRGHNYLEIKLLCLWEQGEVKIKQDSQDVCSMLMILLIFQIIFAPTKLPMTVSCKDWN